MVLRYYFNLRVPLKELKQQCNTTREDGTPTEDLLECLKSYGLLPVHRRKHAGMNDAIRSAIDMGHPVLAVVPTRDPDTEHWVVIHGYTLHPRTFLYRDPRPGFFKISRIKEYVVVGPKTKSAKSAVVQKKWSQAVAGHFHITTSFRRESWLRKPTAGNLQFWRTSAR